MTEPSSDVLSREREEAALWALATGSSQPDGDELRAPVVFRSQPKPIDARHRVAYRTSLLVLTLSRFNRNAAKLANLHLLMWATRSARTRRLLSAWWSGRRFANTVTQRVHSRVGAREGSGYAATGLGSHGRPAWARVMASRMVRPWLRVSIHGWGVARGVEDGCGRHAV